MPEILLASIQSSYQPLPGQTERSSENFTIPKLPPDAQNMLFRVRSLGDDNPMLIRFFINQDHSNMLDATAFAGYDLSQPFNPYDFRNGLQNAKNGASTKMYIAKPWRATADFIVGIYALVRD